MSGAFLCCEVKFATVLFSALLTFNFVESEASAWQDLVLW